MSTTVKGLALAAMFAFIAGAYALINAIPFHGQWGTLFLWSASIACFGFLLGGIFAFDPQSELKIKAIAPARILFGVAAACGLGMLWKWPVDGLAAASIVGGLLGYLGMQWARYVDF